MWWEQWNRRHARSQTLKLLESLGFMTSNNSVVVEIVTTLCCSAGKLLLATRLEIPCRETETPALTKHPAKCPSNPWFWRSSLHALDLVRQGLKDSQYSDEENPNSSYKLKWLLKILKLTQLHFALRSFESWKKYPKLSSVIWSQ